MTKLRINGTTLEYAEHGRGEPILFVHGSASDGRTWKAQRDAISRRYRVVTYSRRYHWPNAPIPQDADYSMAEQLRDLGSLIQSLAIAPAHLVGHSYGAFLALLLAIEHPNLARSLVLAEPPVFTLFVSNKPKPMELLKLAATRPRTAAAIVRFGASGIGPATAAAERGDIHEAMRIFGTAVLGPQAYQRLSRSRVEQVHANSFRAEFLGSGFLPLHAERVQAVQIPALLLTAERSPRLFHCLADGLAELLPNARREQIAAASHMMHEDNPAAFNSAVLSFLADQRSA
jgi:pimeloyl-ACP methyl ester carboxylesterase